MRWTAQQPAGPADTGIALIPGVSPEAHVKILLSVMVVVVAFLLRRALLVLVGRQVQDQEHVYRWAKVSAHVTFLITVLVLIQIWFTALRSLGTFLGLVSAGLAIALRDLVADVAGWAFIAWRKPFDVNDRIQIGPHAGDVVDRRIFQFTIMEIGNWVSADQSTGRLIHIPNAKVFTEPLANYVSGFPYLWNELEVLVTFESDWRKAKRLLTDLALEETAGITREATGPAARREHRFLIRFRKLTPMVYTSVKDSGVLLTLRYLCRPRERRGTAGRIWERLLDLLAEHPDVTLAYPTQRINLAREALSSPPSREVDQEAASGPPDEDLQG